jgi:hypothetical protein
MLEIQCEWQSLSCSKHDPYICLNYAELTPKKLLREYRESYCKEDRYSCYVFWISEAASLKKQALELSGTNKMMK